MNIDNSTGCIELSSIVVSPDTTAEDVKSQCRDLLLQIDGGFPNETIILQNNRYWLQLNFKVGELRRIDVVPILDVISGNGKDEVGEKNMHLCACHEKRPGMPFWEIRYFSRERLGEASAEGVSFERPAHGFLEKIFRRYERLSKSCFAFVLLRDSLLWALLGGIVSFLLVNYIHDGKGNWRIYLGGTLIGLFSPCILLIFKWVEQLMPSKPISVAGIDVNAEREKQIRKLGWRWSIQNDALCRIDLASGMEKEHVEQDNLAEVWLINTDTGPFEDDLWWHCLLVDGAELFIGSEIVADDVRNWFFSLDGFDDRKFIDCMGCTDNRKTLLWRRLPPDSKT